MLQVATFLIGGYREPGVNRCRSFAARHAEMDGVENGLVNRSPAVVAELALQLVPEHVPIAHKERGMHAGSARSDHNQAL